MLVLLAFGMIDFSRALYDHEVMINVSREGSNQAARGGGTSINAALSNAITAVVLGAAPLDFAGSNGKVIISAVFNNAGNITVISQATRGTLSTANSLVGTVGSGAKMPKTSPQIPSTNKTMYVTEVFYGFAPVTPVGKLFMSPTQLYDAAYF